MERKRITFKERTSAEKVLFIVQTILIIAAIVLAILNLTNVLNFPYDIVLLLVAAELLLDGIFQIKHNNTAQGRTSIISAVVLAIACILFITGVFNF